MSQSQQEKPEQRTPIMMNRQGKEAFQCFFFFSFLSFKITRKQKRQIKVLRKCIDRALPGLSRKGPHSPCLQDAHCPSSGESRSLHKPWLCRQPVREPGAPKFLEYEYGMKSNWELQGCLGDS